MIPAIRVLHLEMTERCNAACPMCGRTGLDGQGKPFLNAEITLDDLQSWLSPETIGSMLHIYMCGNYGDAAVARDTLASFRYFREHNAKCSLGLHTNGGARPETWWIELAEVMGRRGKVVFSIDGLENTNHIYRRNVRWDLLERNFRAFIRAGGRAEWHFLVFRHNEDQVDQARVLADREGFEKFVPKKSARVSNQPNKNRYEPLNTEGEPVLAPPVNPKYVNADVQRSENLFAAYGGRLGWLDRTPICCKAQRDLSLYISARGDLWPCCWLGYASVPGELKDVDALLERNGGREQISLRQFPIEQILRSPVFEEIQRGWSSTIAKGRLGKCAKMCSVEVDFHGAQFR